MQLTVKEKYLCLFADIILSQTSFPLIHLSLKQDLFCPLKAEKKGPQYCGQKLNKILGHNPQSPQSFWTARIQIHLPSTFTVSKPRQEQTVDSTAKLVSEENAASTPSQQVFKNEKLEDLCVLNTSTHCDLPFHKTRELPLCTI